MRAIEQESQIPYPYIVRSSYPDYGYLPFVLSLLRTSNYTLIIKDIGFDEGLPNGSWIDHSIRLLSKTSSSTIISCGCLPVKSISFSTKHKQQLNRLFDQIDGAQPCS